MAPVKVRNWGQLLISLPSKRRRSGITRRFLHGLGPVLILLSHVGCLLLFFTGLGISAFVWAVILYVVRMLATTAIYHRLIVHSSYRAPRLVWWVGSVVAASAGQMGPSWWKAHHVQHHRHVDTPVDPHTPLMAHDRWQGFWYSQVGWLFTHNFHPSSLPADIEADPVLFLIDRLHFLPPLFLAAMSWWMGGLEYLAAFFLSTTVLFHGVATVNSVAHLCGDQPFATNDASRNNAWVALITLGEGWHNCHHAFQASVRQGFSLDAGAVRLLPDPTFQFIRLLAWLDLATHLRVPSHHALMARSRFRPSAVTCATDPEQRPDRAA